MNISTMSVNVTDKSISINGEGHICSAEYFPEVDSNIVALHWHPEKQGRCKGSVSRHVGGGEGIDDFKLFEPFVKAWEEAQARKEARSALLVAEAQGAFETDAPVEETPSDLPRFLRPSSQSIAPEMLSRLEDFTKRAQEAVSEAQRSIEASRSDREEIAALRERVEQIATEVASFGAVIKAALEGSAKNDPQ